MARARSTYRQKNRTTIKNAFTGFSARKENFITVRFAELMKYGMEKVLEAHDEFGIVHHHNIDERNTLAWMIFHNGVKVAGDGQDEGSTEGTAIWRIESLGSSTKGWVGFVMSEMTFNWYRVDWEEDFLNYSIEEIRLNYRKIFKPIR